jgi:hypothetical protein
MGFLTGGSKSQSTSDNKAYPWLKDTYAPTVQQGVGAGGIFANALGLGDDPEAASAAFKQFQNSAGFDWMLDQGTRAITGSGAARGLMQSGATLKALTKYGQGLGQQYFDNWLSSVGNVADRGLNAGQLIAGAGQQSQSTSKSSPGLLKAIGDLGAGIGGFAALSDRRLKRNIEKIAELDDGLGVYSYNFPWDPDNQRVGVMADEVEQLRPHALGDKLAGFSTVHYEAL